MKFDPVYFRSILFASTIISAFQSVLWICLTVAAILTHRCVLHTPQYNSDSFVATTLVKFYFEGQNCKVEGSPPGYPNVEEALLTTPDVVFSWMVAYLVVSLIHLALSACLFKHRAGSNELLRLTLKGWCALTFVVLVMDAVLSAMFVCDYLRLKEHIEEEKDDIEDITSIPTAMFVVAARGYALWLINLSQFLYFVLWLGCSSGNPKTDEKRRRTVSISTSYENFNFRNSFESLSHERGGGAEATRSYEAANETPFPATEQRKQSFSDDSLHKFEAVTPFNKDIRPPVPPKPRNLLGERNAAREESEYCNCHQLMASTTSGIGNVHSPWLGKPYHSHGCPLLKAELEGKLERMRLKKGVASPDFSHDIKNFKQGSGQSKARPENVWKLRPPPPPPLPSPHALNCSNSNFY